MAKKTEARPSTGHINPFGLRMQPDLRQRLEEAAVAGGRSLNTEITDRLEDSFEKRDLSWLVDNRVKEYEELSARSAALLVQMNDLQALAGALSEEAAPGSQTNAQKLELIQLHLGFLHSERMQLAKLQGLITEGLNEILRFGIAEGIIAPLPEIGTTGTPDHAKTRKRK